MWKFNTSLMWFPLNVASGFASVSLEVRRHCIRDALYQVAMAELAVGVRSSVVALKLRY